VIRTIFEPSLHGECRIFHTREVHDLPNKCFSVEDIKWYRIFWEKYLKFEEQFG